MYQKSWSIYFSVSTITQKCLKRKSQRVTSHYQIKSKSTKRFIADILEFVLNILNFKEHVISTVLQNQA